MQPFRAQGAIELASPTARPQLGQGATEYLVLLAVVLIVALVSVALLGFFPGMASDAQATQSQTYWKSASPIAITEWAAIGQVGQTFTIPYLRVANTGPYKIRITKMLLGSQSISQIYNGAIYDNFTSYYEMAPGEEKYFAYGTGFYNVPSQRGFVVYSGAGASSTGFLYGASSACATSPPYGSLVMKSFGFEYIEFVEGQQITKQEIGRDVTIKCGPPA